MKAVVGKVEACQRNVTLEETVLQLCAPLLVTGIHCTTASMKEHHKIAFIINTCNINDAYKNVKMYSEKFIMENY